MVYRTVKVVFVLPTYFDKSSVIAGAERYACELARAMARKVDTVLITFAKKRVTRQDGELTVAYRKALFYLGGVANPVGIGFEKDLRHADVIHCLQYRTIVTELAILYGALRKKKVFVTDLSGGTTHSVSSLLPVWRGVHAFLPISEFNRQANQSLPVRCQIIYGGVDTNRFKPDESLKAKKVLYVGRIAPFKGIHQLIDALPEGVALDIIGQSHDNRYLARLQEMSVGKSVRFSHDASDHELIMQYRESLATVLPSLADGGFTTAMESMACGTLVIGTKVGSLPEVVADGRTGFLVAPNDPGAIRERIEYVVANPDVALTMGKSGREKVLTRFTWDAVADRCLRTYGSVG